GRIDRVVDHQSLPETTIRRDDPAARVAVYRVVSHDHAAHEPPLTVVLERDPSPRVADRHVVADQSGAAADDDAGGLARAHDDVALHQAGAAGGLRAVHHDARALGGNDGVG